MKVLIALVLLTGAVAEADEMNCKLTVYATLKNGKKKVTVDEIHAPSFQDCKTEAQLRRMLTSESEDDVENVKVTFGFRELRTP